MIAQFFGLVILLIFFLSLLVFSGEEECQDKGEEERGGGRGRDYSSICRRRPKARRSRKRYVDHAIFYAYSPATLLSFAFSTGKEEDQEGGGGGGGGGRVGGRGDWVVVAAAPDKGVQGK